MTFRIKLIYPYASKIIKGAGYTHVPVKNIKIKPPQPKLTPLRIKTRHRYLWRFHHGDEL